MTGLRFALAAGWLLVAGCAARASHESPAAAATSPLPARHPVAPTVAGAATAAPLESPPPASPSASSQPEPSPTAPPVEPPPNTPPDGAAPDAGTPTLATSSPELAPTPPVKLERPYLDFARPRSKGPVAAASEDELLGRWNVGGSSDPTAIANRAGFHPGTRVTVDARVVSGKLPKSAPVDRRTGKHKVVLSETSLLARARKHGYWPFRLCFEDAARERGPLKGGKTILRFSVGTGGRIASPRLIGTKLEDASVAACLTEKLGSIELLPPPRRVEVELSVQVWPGDVPVPLLPPAPNEAPRFDAETVASTARALEPEVTRCYAAGIAKDPRLWGRVQLHVELGADGTVLRARERESRFPDPEVSRCIQAAVKRLTFARSRDAATSFELPFRLGHLPGTDPIIR